MKTARKDQIGEFWWLPEILSKFSPDPQKCAILTKTATTDQIDEFWWLPGMHSKLSWLPKQCTIAQEFCEKGPNRRVLITDRNSLEIVPRPPNSVPYWRKLQEWIKSTSSDDCQKCPQNCLRIPKQWAIAHEFCERGPNRRVLMTARNALEIVLGP